MSTYDDYPFSLPQN